MKAMLLMLWLTVFGATGCDEHSPATQDVTLGGKAHRLELALDDAARAKGLMHRASIAEDGGMLFVFTEEQVLRFWMKNCLISLDVIYLDRQGRVVKIRQMEPPPPNTDDRDLPFYSSQWPAQFAIELNIGASGKLGVKEGDKIDLPLERLKQLAR